MKMTKLKIGLVAMAGLVGSGLFAVSLSGALNTHIAVPPPPPSGGCATISGYWVCNGTNPARQVSQKDLGQAWVDGTYSGSNGHVMLTPSQCSTVASAGGWHGPLPAALTTTSEMNVGEVLPTCMWVITQSAAQHRLALQSPLSVADNQAETDYLEFDLGPLAPGGLGSPAQKACAALGGACQAIGNEGKFMPTYNMVRLVIPEKAYALFNLLVVRGGK